MIYRSKWVLAFTIPTLLLTGCGGSGNTTSPTPSPTPIIKNSLTGMEGTDGPVLAVKIDDSNPAHPQIGLQGADVVYIEQVEGGETRLAAIFASKIPTHVGPVRSARISDIDLLSQYGHVAFAFSGAQSKMYPVINAADLENLGAQHESPTIYTRDSSRYAPYNMVLRADFLLAKVAKDKSPIAISKPMGWTFGKKPAGGTTITMAKFQWPAVTYKAHWSKREKRWLLDYQGKPDVDSDGVRLGASTLVIQLVSITDSIYHDKVGGITPLSKTIGQGTGFILRDGKSFAANWQRLDAASGTTWTLADGSPISFAAGQIWVALLDTPPIFTYPAVTPSASASPSPTK